MHETHEDIAHLDELIDRSFAEAGPHLVSIATPERRLRGDAVCEAVTGMSLLALATVTADGRPIVGAVDGIFYRAAFYFSSSRDSLRYRHLAVRPFVSATHLPGEHLAVTVHGRAVEIDLDGADQHGFRETVLEVYLPRYGDEFLTFLEAGVVYWRIDADRMFTFYAPEVSLNP
ncbi:MAG: pyridoxamine 5'-phosphate oxidase family protein [Candidatus Dormibacter sp.]